MLFRCLLLTVAVAPLPFASAPMWAWSSLSLVVGLLILWWGVRLLRGREWAMVRARTIAPIAVPFLLAVAWAALQASGSAVMSNLHHPLWTEAGAALRTEVDASITLDRFDTGSAIARLVAYGGIFWLAVHYARLPWRAELAVLVIAIAGSVYAVYGLAEFFGSDRILGYEKTAYAGSLTSTFINRNSYATFAGLTLLCTTLLLIQPLLPMSSVSGEHSPPSVTGGFWEKFNEALTVRTGLLLSAWIFQCVALYLTGSRGGILSSGLALLGFLLAVAAVRLGSASLRIGIVVAGCVALFLVFLASGGGFAARMLSASAQFAERQNVYRITTGLVLEHPLVGTGYGTFADAFRTGRDDSVGNIYDKAHDVYLENALELGIPGAALLGLAVAGALFQCVVGLRARNPGRIYSCLGLGATVLVAVHGLVDFSPEIPAVAATFALLLGTAVAQSCETERNRQRPLM